MIQVTSMTRKHGVSTAVDDVSFTGQTGQTGRVTGFLGPNGAGKTTTMRAAAIVGYFVHSLILPMTVGIQIATPGVVLAGQLCRVRSSTGMTGLGVHSSPSLGSSP